MSERDAILAAIADFSAGFDLSAAAVQDVEAARLRVLDTFGAALGGFDETASVLTRNLALRSGGPADATVFGTSCKTGIEMAAFANATASREAEMNDVYMSRAGAGAHPSDVILPILAVCEARNVSGRDFLAAVLIAYEIYVQMSDDLKIEGFDQTVLAGLAIAAGAARALGLDRRGIAQAVSIAAVANNPLNQARRDRISMWKAIASGQAGKAGVFAALAAEGGLEGPEQPFAGSCGWLHNLAQGEGSLGRLGAGERLRIGEVAIKPRASCQVTISAILAAEQAAARIDNPGQIAAVRVETYAFAWQSVGSGEHRWDPQSRESADHSIPYVTAAALVDGTVGPAQFRPDRLRDPLLRQVMSRVEVVPDDEFTARHQTAVPEHHSRVTVTMKDGSEVVGRSGGEHGDPSDVMNPLQVEDKFRKVAAGMLGADRSENAIIAVRDLTDMERAGDLHALFAVNAA